MSLLEQANKVLQEQVKYGDINAGEVYVERKRTTFLRVERGQFQVGTISEEWGGAIRVLINQGLGFATFTTERLGSNAFKSAIDNARAAPPNPHATIPEPSKVRSEFEGFDPKLDTLEPEEMVESLQIVQNVFNDKRVHGSVAIMGVSRHDIAIANTHGIEHKSRATQLTIGLECYAKSGDVIGVGIGDARSPTTQLPISVEEMATKTLDDAVLNLKQRKVTSGTMPVILHPIAVRELLGWVFIPEILGHNVVKGVSPFTEKLGESIASDTVTLTDKGTSPLAFYPSPVDDEGVPRQDITVIENGILQSFLYDSTSAKEAGLDSTGNCGRFRSYDGRSYAYPPTCVTHELTFQAGSASFEEMIEDVKLGVYIFYPIGAHSGNIANGEFNIAPYSCYLIENGELTGGLKKFIFSSSIPEILKKIETVGKDAQRNAIAFNHQVTSPHMFLRDVKIVSD